MKIKRKVNTLITLSMMASTAMNVSAVEIDDELYSQLQSAISGDRTQACLMIATVGKQVKRAALCANPEDLNRRNLDYDTLFEIGSISKTMTAAVLAGVMQDNKLSLNDTLSSILPSDAQVPEFKSKKIRLKHIVTHSSGLPALPSNMHDADPKNPYAKLDGAKLVRSLEDVELSRAPGRKFEYSNYAMMLLSFGLANTTGKSFDQLLDQYVFGPLNMNSSYAHTEKTGVSLAKGHSQTGQEVSHWDFKQNLHGVGGIRSSMNDMIRYAQANLGVEASTVSSILNKTHEKVLSTEGQSMGMTWARVKVAGRNMLMHEGGTGGFSSAILLDKKNQFGVVILSDTALTNLGGLSAIALHLFDPAMPLPAARLEQDAPSKLLHDLAGEYTLVDAGMTMTLSHKSGQLIAQAAGQDAFKLAYDSSGEFYPTSFDALLRPVQTSKGWGFQWMQGGAAMMAEPKVKSTSDYSVSADALKSYVGYYPLTSGFGLKVAVQGDSLTVQGTGQSALAVTPLAKDEFVQDDVGAYFIFDRDDSGQISSLTLKQAGQVLRGDKQ